MALQILHFKRQSCNGVCLKKCVECMNVNLIMLYLKQYLILDTYCIGSSVMSYVHTKKLLFGSICSTNY